MGIVSAQRNTGKPCGLCYLGPLSAQSVFPGGLGHLRRTLPLPAFYLAGRIWVYGSSGNLHCVLHTGPKRVNPPLVWVLSESQPCWDQRAFVRAPGRAPELRRSYCCRSLVTRCSIWSDSKTPNFLCGFVHAPGFQVPTKNNHAHLANTILGPSCGVDYSYPAEP